MVTAVEGTVNGGGGFVERGLLRWGSQGRNHIAAQEAGERASNADLFTIFERFVKEKQ